ncbi:glycosyltransferase family 4 protein [Geminocystis sp. CENA526]|uniref:glycosyltransferase family 4 protein n=1 Tax=Geminocystis sp. CENA526 TaxID=1355871 RepID=UPI003D6DB457
MKILVDCGSIRDCPSGVGYYTYNLIKSLKALENDTDYSFNIYRQPSMAQWLKGSRLLPDSLQDISPLQFLPLPVTVSNFLGKSAGLFVPKFDRFWQDVDIIHGTDHYVYPFSDGKKVMTIHDLTFLKYPFYSNQIVKTYTQRIKKCLQWTDLIITFANSTKQDIMEYFGVKSEKIVITSEASRYNNNYLKSKNIELIKSKINYDFSQPYILFVSTIEPRKNIINLVKAFNLLKKNYGINHHLILVGQKGWNYETIFGEIENSEFKQDIHHLGYLSDEEVAVCYHLTDVFVYPSFYEGFGLPVLEAMTLGAPVITSNTSSLPEVAQDSALYINPEDYISLADTIYQVISQPDLREDLIMKGTARSKLYSWDRVAQETIKAYELIT